jgi:H+/Cl- antiporter ClcA
MTPVRERVDHLGDFTLGRRVLVLAAWAVPIGAAGAVAALALLRLIALITNLVFYQRIDTRLMAPGAGHHQPLLILLAPVIGGLIVGLMARFGSEKIRGHGMPEAIEAILVRGSRVDPRVAVLKPISAAVSIGTGGPFGAEGPIIMTGGAVGSVLAQTLHMSADERKTLLVAGAAAGMAATFDAPLASVLLAVELLLFEWRPAASFRWSPPSSPARCCAFPSSGTAHCSRCRWRICTSPPATSCCASPRAPWAGCWRSPPPAWSMPRRTRSRACASTGCGGRPSAD